jgi:hypothetical protein
MLNVKTLTDTMSRMELPQLQQYAALHKNDPYIVTLALSIANQKKQMKMGQDGQAGMQPQPTVVDQDIFGIPLEPQPRGAVPPQQQMAQALPEDQGIGTLPAQNMQNFAGGGIVAFEEGGDVPGYQSGAFLGELSPQQIEELYKTDPKLAAQAEARASMSAVGNSLGKASGIATKSFFPLMLGTELFLTPPHELARLKAAEAKKSPAARTAAAQSVLNESPEDYALRKVSELEAKGGKRLSPDAKNMAMSQFVKDKIGGQVQRGEASLTTSSQLPAPATTYTGEKPLPGLTPPGLKALKPDAISTAAKPSADDEYLSGVNKLLGSVQTASSVGPVTQFDAKKYSFTPAQFADMTPEFFADAVTKAMGKEPAKDPFGAQTDELTKTAVATKQNYKTDLAKQFKEQGLAFEGTLKKLTEKEGRINTMEERNTGLALLEAGLSMMSGESPHAMVNIGKGAQVGTKKYAEGLAQIEAARDKVDEAKMKIEEFRRNEANMNAREERAAQKDIDDTLHQGAVLKLAGMRDAFNMNKNQALASVTNYMQIQQFNVGQKNQAEMHNQSTAAGLDTAYAQMANQRTLTANQIASNERIAERARSTQLGLAALEAKYKQQNPAAGSLGFFREIGKGDPVKGMEIYSRSLGPEAKGDEALVASYIKNPTALMALEATDPKLAAQIKQKIQMQMLQPLAKPADVNRP